MIFPKRIIAILKNPNTKGVAWIEAQKHVMAIAQGGCLILAGKTGIGKTVAACGVASAIIDMQSGGGELLQEKTIFIKANEVLKLAIEPESERMAGYNAFSGSELFQNFSPFDEFLKSPLLIIDDLGCEQASASGWDKSIWDQVFDYRYSNYLATIVTTNKRLKDFTTQYGERILSRVTEWGKFRVISDVDLRRSR